MCADDLRRYQVEADCSVGLLISGSSSFSLAPIGGKTWFWIAEKGRLIWLIPRKKTLLSIAWQCRARFSLVEKAIL